MTANKIQEAWEALRNKQKEFQNENSKSAGAESGTAPLSAERVRSLLEYNPDTGHLYWKSDGRRAGSIQDKGYRTIEIDGRSYYAHRIAWLHYTGSWPDNELDHKNREKDDNSIENLRDVTRSENNKNRRSWTWSKKDEEVAQEE